MDKTPIIEFPNEDNMDFKAIDKKVSIKSNIFILSSNFNDLKKWLARFKEYAIYNQGLIDIDNLLNILGLKFQSNKTSIIIPSTLNIGEIITQTSNTIIYEITRVDFSTIEITNVTTPNWNVDNLIIIIKDIYGVFVYPIMKTIDNKITINFNDGILNNYRLILS